MEKHYVEEIGTDILVDVGTDVTGATDLKLKVEKPDGTTAEWTAIVDGTDYLKHTTISTDFDQAGLYRLQASLTIGGWVGLGETASFVIYNSYA